MGKPVFVEKSSKNHELMLSRTDRLARAWLLRAAAA
jgi:hypothetical protein